MKLGITGPPNIPGPVGGGGTSSRAGQGGGTSSLAGQGGGTETFRNFSSYNVS